MNEYCPFVEKHRPKRFDDIVLEAYNRQILTNIITTSHFPNMLFYGPPGTGKTTTIINVINAYQDRLGKRDNGLVIHLNASDERGIDTIRNQICSFVSSNPLFNTGIKFVILDEVDYMTKNAQQALRYLLQEYSTNVRFCLICNYISKIDDGLQNEFLKLRFNQLPQEEIVTFLEKITTEECIPVSRNTLGSIQRLYKSDIRSMVNFIQTNQDMVEDTLHIIDNDVWSQLYDTIISTENMKDLLVYIHGVSFTYNMNVKNILTDFLNYLIRTRKELICDCFLKFVENVISIQYVTTEQTEHVLYSLRKTLRILLHVSC